MATVRRTYDQLTDWVQEQLFFRQLGSPLGYLVMILIALGSSMVVIGIGLKPSAALVILVLGAPVMILSLINLRIGLGLALVAAFMINFLAKYTYQPVGVLLDGLAVDAEYCHIRPTEAVC